MATKQQLRDEIKALRWVGAQMSNVCFNLGQRYDDKAADEAPVLIFNRNLATMWELRKDWDAIRRAE